MKTLRFTDSQILLIPKQAESGTPVPTLCCEHGMSSALAQQCCSGPEFISREFVNWVKQHGIRIEYIQPGKPQQNAYIERYNRTMRYSLVSKHLFDTLEQVQDYATKWLWFYNHERPHRANGGKPSLMAA